MNHLYHKNYFDSIYKGMINSIYYERASIIDAEIFFTRVIEIIHQVQLQKSKIYFFGNGASASFANHMALDFSKNGKILSRSLSDSALMTALSNDFSFEQAMVEFLKIEEVGSNDLVVTISSSGNSPNILNVLKYCNELNLITLALSGLKSDNKSISLSNYSIYVPMKTYGMVECIHQIFLHLILDNFMKITEWDRVDFQNMNFSDFKL